MVRLLRSGVEAKDAYDWITTANNTGNHILEARRNGQESSRTRGDAKNTNCNQTLPTIARLLDPRAINQRVATADATTKEIVPF